MEWDDLAAKGYITSTGKGRRVDVHIRVYPQGHGQLVIRRGQGSPAPLELMCNGPDDAVSYLRRIWEVLASQDSVEEQPGPESQEPA